LHCQVRGEGHFTVRRSIIPHREADGKFTALGLVEQSSVEVSAHVVPLGFGKGALETQEETVIIDAGVVNAAGIADEGVVEGSEVEKLVPVAAVACQARDIGDENDTDVAEGDGGDERLETVAMRGRNGRFAKVVVDDSDLFGVPAQGVSAVAELVLQVLAFEILSHLAHRGLTDVDVSLALQMLGEYLGMLTHRSPPSAGGGSGVASA